MGSPLANPYRSSLRAETQAGKKFILCSEKEGKQGLPERI